MKEVVVVQGVGLNGKMNKRLCEAMTEGKREEEERGVW